MLYWFILHTIKRINKNNNIHGELMLYNLSYAKVKMLSDNLAEVIVDHNITITLEMIEELDRFIQENFKQPFALLVNKINQYEYTFEAMASMVSHELLIAMAVINYDDIAEDPIHQVIKIRAIDQLNIKVFSGLELGFQAAKAWLIEELANVEA